MTLILHFETLDPERDPELKISAAKQVQDDDKEQQATSNKQQATSNKQQATSNKQQVTSNQ